ncbi:MAG TPA: hypothetical protein VLS89_08120 [Candidatus Nanopelagicales bacterium]|nr:hypothetical protein [Candidatus Nanopelagicales bacterium]
MQHRRLGLLGLGALCIAALSSAAMGGCQAESNSTGSNGPSGPGGTGGSATTTSTGEGGGTGGNGTGGNGTGGSGGGAELPVVTIQDITSGVAMPGSDVQVKGVIAMSPKYLVSQSSSGSCLYGVYISAPGLTETQPYSGVLAVSYGSQATQGSDGKLYCARLGQDPAGDAFPDDVRPGDVLNIVGETSHFLLSFCGDACGDTTCTAAELACYEDPDCPDFRCWDDCSADPIPYRESAVKQRQLAKVTMVERTGNGPVPTPHTLTGAEIAGLSSSDDQEFHDQWGGVKVRIEGATPVPWSQGNIVNFGSLVADVGGARIQVANDIYYRGYAPDTDQCHNGPTFTDATITWNRIDGFSTIDRCLWVLQAADPCADLEPMSGMCTSATDCSE